MDPWTGPRQSIGVAAEAITGSRQLVALPTQNPSMGCTLEVIGLTEMGWLLIITDPMGAPVWRIMLEGAK